MIKKSRRAIAIAAAKDASLVLVWRLFALCAAATAAWWSLLPA